MNKCCSPARANNNNNKCGQLSQRVPEANPVRLRAESKTRHGPGAALMHRQDSRESFPVSSSNMTPRSDQRRWSADLCKCGTSPVFTVRKNKKEPEPPQRGVSLRPQAAPHQTSKRYSCPPIGVFKSPTHSSSSSSSSCSSPPPTRTSVITGPDPSGWKLRPKSRSSSARARTNRLSLQIPLPVVFPEHQPVTNSLSVSSLSPEPEAEPLVRPKPHGRRHSDSSALLRSLATPQPALTLADLYAVRLRRVSDNVFSEGNEEKVEVKRKIPPAVPEKTSMVRQIAQLMAESQQHCEPVPANEEIIYTSVIKPKNKQSHTSGDHSSLSERIAGLRVESRCDRETPRFPG
ncbi:uncharacterized protein LOC131959556 [Centropristis striata]|uniref:uncharacterized protein LOC131959556 n=1 Tax=Centropristis striata TaxID=184440 RepID=UPI0027E04C36|nr:uncharacterized protein LOC131959556 [Centropristis striata]